MAKARMYGAMWTYPKPSQRLDRCWQRTLERKRQRETLTRNPVADKTAKEKEANV